MACYLYTYTLASNTDVCVTGRIFNACVTQHTVISPSLGRQYLVCATDWHHEKLQLTVVCERLYVPHHKLLLLWSNSVRVTDQLSG